MTKRPSGRVKNSFATPSAAGALRTVNPLDLNRQENSSSNNTAQPSSTGGRKNVSPSTTLPSSSPSYCYSTGPAYPQDPIAATGQPFFSTHTPVPGFPPDSNANADSDFILNFCTPFPSPGELAWCVGMGGESSWGGGGSDSSCTTLPSAALRPGVIVEEVSRLLGHATVTDLFQIQNLVESKLNSISQFVCASQPLPPTWDGGSIESATFMGSDPQQQSNNEQSWQMSTLDPWTGSGPDWT